jgi:hemerythrin-like domain-containing protein
MPTPGLVEFFTGDHRSCDELWTRVEAASDEGAESIAAAWRCFDTALRSHLAMEEEVLFPAFEAATGMKDSGPTFVMRMEHDQMRGLLDQMGAALERGDHETLLDQGDTLLLLIQQHNQKEEGMLYPMSERALAAEWPALYERVAEYVAKRQELAR